MKKSYLLFLLTLLPLLASATAVEINGIYYTLDPVTKIAVVTTNPKEYSGNIVIPETVTYGAAKYNVTTIGKDAFRTCTRLTSISIPSSITTIGGSAFRDCWGLEKVIVKDIASWCRIRFSSENGNPLYCANHLYSDEHTEITNLVIPNGVTSISDFAFLNCTGLTSVTIPEGVTYIGIEAFWNCSGMTSITIPNSFSSIGRYTFSGCTGLTTVISNILNPSENCCPLSKDIRSKATLIVPKGTKEKYMATDGWNDFLFIEEKDGTTGGGTSPAEDEVPTEATVSISSARQGTFCYDYDLDFSGVEGIKAYVASGFDPENGNILLMRVMQVPAGTGLLVKGNAGKYKIPVKETTFYYLNMFKPVFEATTVPEQSGSYTNYVLANGPDGLLFYKSSNASLGANRAYIQIPTSLLGTRSNTRSLGMS